ncbi:MAG: hypothetical protein Q4G50_10645 [Corynebacterium sp.]|uniref:hypothetical protein n=1 Tax=Corynebacterium sp. TaxID=1720 RepID=UPI0026DF1472|nr:hypothetical protein [Corynebacterium sp.]MDO5670453.1 hypothetical protein [Corynebacterium sp.]
MKLPPVRRRRHGKFEELAVEDLDPYLVVPDDAVVGSYSDDEVVFLGPVGVGKTTAVASLSTVAPITTEVRAATPEDFYARWKTTTTVGIDFGVWDQPDGTRIALFGTAGQDRFDDARAPARNPDAAIVLWFFGYGYLLEEQVEEWIPVIEEINAMDRLVVAVNFLDPEFPDPVPALREHFARRGYPHIPVSVADPREKEQVAHVVTQVLSVLKEKR